MRFKLLAGVLLGAGMLAAAPASAATFTIDGGTPDFLPNPTFNPTPFTGASPGDPVTLFESATNGGSIGGGLKINPDGAGAMIRVTFLGKEAGADNSFIELTGANGTLNNKTSVVGDFIDFADAGGFVDFLFRTTNADQTVGFNPSITNGGISEFAPLSMSFSSIFTGDKGGDAVLAFFGDGRGDNDFDDMVVSIQIIPLPAGILLMLTALGGLGFFA
ncbi:MAG: VPLPA-CTERM sorting domain-containing protein, partial [Pseudomonadota bacterium]